VPRFVALLRGVNVGGHGKVSMADLREAFARLGYDDVATVVQSGNVVFTAGKTTAAALERTIEKTLAADLGTSARVLVRTGAELTRIVAANPFLDAADDGTKLHVLFADRAPDAARVKAVDRDRYLPEEFAVRGREIYLSLPNGLGRSVLMPALTEKKLGITATARNWNTIGKLLALCSQQS
jgi:uncharacterized protein (DUF1697 family)